MKRVLTDERVRFRIRTADFEVEFEGPTESARSRYDDMVSRLRSGVSRPLNDNEVSRVERPKGKRGGIRSSVIAKALDEVIDEEWFKTKRPEKGILGELQNRRVPGVEKGNLKVALDRRVRAGKLKSIRDQEGWVYWSGG